jgi:predicted signal transduction protein with EAL and GGDEF domain
MGIADRLPRMRRLARLVDGRGQRLAVAARRPGPARAQRRPRAEDCGLAGASPRDRDHRSTLLRQEQEIRAVLHELRDMGVRLSMDDFGTGYSSLSQLRSFPFDKIKIDRSFVRDLPSSKEATAVVRSIVALGSSLGMTTTAEGVETTQQAAQVGAEGCTYIQGYLVSKPVSAAELAPLIVRYAPQTNRAARPTTPEIVE